MRFYLFLAACFLAAHCQNPKNPSVAIPANSALENQVGRPPEPEWARNAVIYECNIRQFSSSGDFQGAKRELLRLKNLGIDVVWLMPIFPIGLENRKGQLGSPYSVRDFLAVNPDYGTLDDLRELVDEAHKLGLKILLDWVPNHTAWDAVWKAQHPEYYSKYNGDFTVPLNEKGEPIADWSDVCDLDYSNPGTRRAMIGAMQYWLRETDIDGFRVDMAGLVPNDFWAEARPALDSVKTVYMLGEWQDEPLLFHSAFNANYGWKWKDVTKDIANGRQNALALDSLLGFLQSFYPEWYYQLYFTQNHDENTHTGTEFELYGQAAESFAVLSFVWQGIPLIYNGQEDSLVQRLAFFERDPIQWKTYSRTPFYQKLCMLRHYNRAVWSGLHGGTPVKIPTDQDEYCYAFSREKEGDRVLAVFNFSNKSRQVQLRPDNELLGAYANVFGENTVQLTRELTLTLKPWEYLILTNK